MDPDLKASYVVAVAEQLSFVSAFLGGVSATILFTVIIFSSDKKVVSLVIAASALSACSLLVCVISGWRLTIGLHPDLPFSADPEKLDALWKLLIASYSLGVISLLASTGLSGWIRSPRTGIVTSLLAGIAIFLFVSTSVYVR
ncbi:MAG: hypothetical protein AAF194_03830 [Pseudomonadota bacterium]